LLITFLVSSWRAAVAADAAGSDEQFLSLLPRTEDVFGATELGIYRGDRATRHWQRLDLPDSIPVGGKFAREEPGGTDVYYFAQQDDTDVSRHGKSPGIYRSDDRGKTWVKVDQERNVFCVYVHADGSVYSLSWEVKAHVGYQTRIGHVRWSRDRGTTWRDITNDAPGELVDIIGDPDNPRLIALVTQSVRPYLLQAENDGYNWTVRSFTRPKGARIPDDEFLFRNYRSDNLYLQVATLANYFDRPFGSAVHIPAFDITAESPRYSFRQGNPKGAAVKLSFEPAMAETAVTLIDSDSDPRVCWSAKVIDPADRQRVTTKGDLRRGPQTIPASPSDLRTFSVDRAHPYSKTIDLSKLGDFTVPGRYKVQISYENRVELPGQQLWHGNFDGEVFEVDIVP
jgi:hypothetical protein